ncbi:nucleotidyl transferase AbiEii/AbiGii toxin family protein [Rhizobium johnstonii]|uniref:nucleotidyl transferase AbiEii/AbiGii toxin family protein n=1 Tax=Rhizobium johnstonii TaxID=3019933 RepID=UPI003F953DF8
MMYINEDSYRRGEATRTAIKDTCKSKGLNPERYAARYVVERILDTIPLFHKVRFLVKGGITLPQEIRDTADGDIQFARRFSEDELYRVLSLVSDHLERHEGIKLTRIPRGPQVIETAPGVGDAWRYRMEASIGGMRVNPQLDMTFAGSFPNVTGMTELPSLLKRSPPLRCYAQPLAALAADKWIAILTRTPDDMRVKEYADVMLLDRLGAKPVDIAREIERVARARKLPMGLFRPAPDALSYESVHSRRDRWDQLRALRKLDDKILDVWVAMIGIWADIHEKFVVGVQQDLRRPDYAPKIVGNIIHFPVARAREAAFKPR